VGQRPSLSLTRALFARPRRRGGVGIVHNHRVPRARGVNPLV
jgi:hypothetical protein